MTSEPTAGGPRMGRRRFIQAAAALASGAALAAAGSEPQRGAAQVSPPTLIRPRVTPPEPAADSELKAVVRRGLALPGSDRGDLLVLNYHQVFNDSPRAQADQNPFSVTASQLMSHLAMLRSTGFRPVRLADVVRARRLGRQLPPRSVLVTFDDGTAGQWVHGDAVLRRAGFTAVTFLITGYVGTTPAFLTWDETRAMAASGRWEIGDHTHRDHHTIPAGPSMQMQSALINRAWNPRTRTFETLPDAENRVRTDLDLSVSVLQRERLGRPLGFAYPFSRVEGPTNDPALSDYAEQVAARLFAVSFTNFFPGRLVTPADLAAGLLPRFEVHRHVTAVELYEQIRAANLMAVPPPARSSAVGLMHRH